MFGDRRRGGRRIGRRVDWRLDRAEPPDPARALVRVRVDVDLEQLGRYLGSTPPTQRVVPALGAGGERAGSRYGGPDLVGCAAKCIRTEKLNRVVLDLDHPIGKSSLWQVGACVVRREARGPPGRNFGRTGGERRRIPSPWAAAPVATPASCHRSRSSRLRTPAWTHCSAMAAPRTPAERQDCTSEGASTPRMRRATSWRPPEDSACLPLRQAARPHARLGPRGGIPAVFRTGAEPVADAPEVPQGDPDTSPRRGIRCTESAGPDPAAHIVGRADAEGGPDLDLVAENHAGCGPRLTLFGRKYAEQPPSGDTGRVVDAGLQPRLGPVGRPHRLTPPPCHARSKAHLPPSAGELGPGKPQSFHATTSSGPPRAAAHRTADAGLCTPTRRQARKSPTWRTPAQAHATRSAGSGTSVRRARTAPAAVPHAVGCPPRASRTASALSSWSAWATRTLPRRSMRTSRRCSRPPQGTGNSITAVMRGTPVPHRPDGAEAGGRLGVQPRSSQWSRAESDHGCRVAFHRYCQCGRQGRTGSAAHCAVGRARGRGRAGTRASVPTTTAQVAAGQCG